MTHDSCSLQSVPGKPRSKDPWKIERIARRAIRFSILLARHSALLAESKAFEAATQHTRQIETFQGEGGQGG